MKNEETIKRGVANCVSDKENTGKYSVTRKNGKTRNYVSRSAISALIYIIGISIFSQSSFTTLVSRGVSTSTSYSTASILASISCAVIACVVFLKPTNYTAKKIVPHGFISPKDTLLYIGLGTSGILVINIALSFATSLVTANNALTENATGIQDYDFTSILLMLATMALVPAIVEEFLYRGIFLNVIKQNYGNGVAIIATSIIFALSHDTAIQVGYTFFVGLILAVIAIKCNTIWIPMIIHLIINASSVFINIGMGVVYNTVFVVMSVALLITTVVIQKKKKIIPKIHWNLNASCKKYFKSFGFILYSAIMIIVIILGATTTTS